MAILTKASAAFFCALLAGAPQVQAASQLGTGKGVSPVTSAVSHPALSLSAHEPNPAQAPLSPAAAAPQLPALPSLSKEPTPEALKLAQELGMDIGPVKPQKAGERVTAEDIKRAATEAAEAGLRSRFQTQGKTLQEIQALLDAKQPLSSVLGLIYEGRDQNPFRSWSEIPLDPRAAPRWRPETNFRTLPTREEATAIFKQLLDHKVLSYANRGKLADLVEQAHARKNVLFLGQLAFLSIHDTLTKTMAMKAVRSFLSSEDAWQVVTTDAERPARLLAFEDHTRIHMTTQLVGHLDDPRAVEPFVNPASASGRLLKMAENDSDEAIRVAAIEALVSARPASAAALLGKILNTGKKSDGESKDKKNKKTGEDVPAEAPPNVKLAALHALEVIGSPEETALPILRALPQNARHEELLDLSIFALLRIGHEPSLLELAHMVEAELVDCMNKKDIPSLSLTARLLRMHEAILSDGLKLSQKERASLDYFFSHVSRIDLAPLWHLLTTNAEVRGLISSRSPAEALRKALAIQKAEIELYQQRHKRSS